MRVSIFALLGMICTPSLGAIHGNNRRSSERFQRRGPVPARRSKSVQHCDWD